MDVPADLEKLVADIRRVFPRYLFEDIRTYWGPQPTIQCSRCNKYRPVSAGVTELTFRRWDRETETYDYDWFYICDPCRFVEAVST